MKTRTSKTKLPKVSIIICLHIIGDRFYRDLQKFLHLKYPNYEIIIVVNKNAQVKRTGVPFRLIRPTKSSISLGEKRDLGVNASRGKYCAFIDDDAYPDEYWLNNALKIFSSDTNIGAVGGPNLTPGDDPYWARIGGRIFESYLTSGGQQWRFLPLGRREVSELQGVNMIFPKKILQEIKGFRTKLYSGDDSVVCSDIRRRGYRVVSDSSIIVYHHRREFPIGHLKQIYTMGTHRGFFVRLHPETLGFLYFLPAVLTIGLFIGIISGVIYPNLILPFLVLFLVFYLAGYFSTLSRAGYFDSLLISFGIILTHMTYGLSFIRGMCLTNLNNYTTK